SRSESSHPLHMLCSVAHICLTMEAGFQARILLSLPLSEVASTIKLLRDSLCDSKETNCAQVSIAVRKIICASPPELTYDSELGFDDACISGRKIVPGITASVPVLHSPGAAQILRQKNIAPFAAR